MKEFLSIRSDRCKSCGLCIAACPREALSVGGEFNAGGYRYVTVDTEKCVLCSTCYIACPDYVFEIKEVSA